MGYVMNNCALKVAKGFLILGLSFFTGSAFAEYYMAYSTPCSNVVWLTSPRVKHSACGKKYKHKRHVRHVRRYRTADISVTYMWPPPACCGGCCTNTCMSSCLDSPAAYGDYSYRVYTAPSYDSSYVYWNEGYRYYPDLATADDDPIVYPDMQMDY